MVRESGWVDQISRGECQLCVGAEEKHAWKLLAIITLGNVIDSNTNQSILHRQSQASHRS